MYFDMVMFSFTMFLVSHSFFSVASISCLLLWDYLSAAYSSLVSVLSLLILCLNCFFHSLSNHSWHSFVST